MRHETKLAEHSHGKIAPMSGWLKEGKQDNIKTTCLTCTELIMVLRAKTVAESRSVDWLSKVPWVSISRTANWNNEIERGGHCPQLHCPSMNAAQCFRKMSLVPPQFS